MPVVSIIIPVYNAQNAISRCIDSILNQEFTDFELILMDDGSKDNTPSILDEYATKDERIKVIHKPNSGVSDTRNMALSMASGKYIQFLDADDWMTSNSTKELVRAMEVNNADLVVADFYRVVGEHVSKKGSIDCKKVLTLKEYSLFMMDSPADYYYGVLWNKLYKKSIIDEFHIQMDKTLSFCEDFIFNLEYYLHCERIYPLNVPIYYYVKTEGSLVSQNLSFSKIYNMKVNVYEYYDSFLKNVFSQDEYDQEKLSIAKFYVAPAFDDLVIPLIPSTKKLGLEKERALYNNSNEESIISLNYYIFKGYSKMLSVIGNKYNLDLKDVAVLDSIKDASSIHSYKEIADYLGMSEATIYLSVQKLRILRYIHVDTINDALCFEFKENSHSICHDLEQAKIDLYRLCFKNLDEQTISVVNEAFPKMIKSLKDYLN